MFQLPNELSAESESFPKFFFVEQLFEFLVTDNFFDVKQLSY